jgi:hypothetical protein
MTLTIAIFALLAASLALIVTILGSSTQQHFYVHSQCSRVIGLNGQERDSRSFSSRHKNTLIGHTIGRIFIAVAYAKHVRMARKLETKQEA